MSALQKKMKVLQASKQIRRFKKINLCQLK